jgi:hypothetical protein
MISQVMKLLMCGKHQSTGLEAKKDGICDPSLHKLPLPPSKVGGETQVGEHPCLYIIRYVEVDGDGVTVGYGARPVGAEILLLYDVL